ncbi:MAG: hypothetical protein KL787_00530 [Taibaiella sp.]|nr:hypothetical protein [Taibaiella sp.]
MATWYTAPSMVHDQWWGPTRNQQSVTEVFFYEIIAEPYFDEKTIHLKGDITIIQ